MCFSEHKSFTKISNCILDKLMRHLTPAECKVFLAIVRHTIGFHKNVAPIAYSTLASFTGLSKRGVVKCVSSLEKKGIIHVSRDKTGKTNIYNATYDELDKKLVTPVTPVLLSKPVALEVVTTVHRGG